MFYHYAYGKPPDQAEKPAQHPISLLPILLKMPPELVTELNRRAIEASRCSRVVPHRRRDATQGRVPVRTRTKRTKMQQNAEGPLAGPRTGTI